MKRVFDILSSGLALILLMPVFILIALLVKLDSKGPLIFKQIRVGKGEVDFWVYKFRTMKPNSDHFLITVGDRDPRITTIGYFLRKYKLDELPQLVNILKGDMSVVGPRPEVREYVDLYSEEQLQVFSVRPGLTDYASLKYVNEPELIAQSDNPEKLYIEEIMPAKLELSLRYIQERNFKTDLVLIVKTILKIIS